MLAMIAFHICILWQQLGRLEHGAITLTGICHLAHFGRTAFESSFKG
jgi:hypothetical protein